MVYSKQAYTAAWVLNFGLWTKDVMAFHGPCAFSGEERVKYFVSLVNGEPEEAINKVLRAEARRQGGRTPLVFRWRHKPPDSGIGWVIYPDGAVALTAFADKNTRWWGVTVTADKITLRINPRAPLPTSPEWDREGDRLWRALCTAAKPILAGVNLVLPEAIKPRVPMIPAARHKI